MASEKEELKLITGMLPAIGIGTAIVVGIGLLGRAFYRAESLCSRR